MTIQNVTYTSNGQNLTPDQRRIIEACPMPDPKFCGGMNGTTKSKRLMATVYIYIERKCGVPIADAWAISHTPAAARAPFDFNPVEINIRPEDVAGAVDKWEAICDRGEACRVTYHFMMRCDRYNDVHDAPKDAAEKEAMRLRYRPVTVEIVAEQ